MCFTALRAAAILRTRLQKGYGTTAFALHDEKGEGNDSNIVAALNFVSKGGEILKRTRKGTLVGMQFPFLLIRYSYPTSKLHIYN